MDLFPVQASNLAGPVDALYVFLIVTCGGLAVLLAVLVIGFTLRYHRKPGDEIPPQPGHAFGLEVAWTFGTLALFLVFFFWGTVLYFRQFTPPPESLEIYATGKQWMWKVQHPGGQREINELHVPVGSPVRITLTSQDVIHSFFVPAFRVKQDVLPGRYTTLWFTATKAGRYHLFCTEYCGVEHSGMIGYVYALEPGEFSRWLVSGAAEGSLAAKGEKAFHQYGCSTCHDFSGGGPGPGLKNVYGSQVRLRDGSVVLADEAYLRESILNSQAKVVYGFEPVMPSYQGQIPEEEVVQLIEYIRSMAVSPARMNPSTPGYAPQPWGTQPGVGAPAPAGQVERR